MDFLKTLKVPSPVFPNDVNKVSFISSESTIADGFQLLISQNILSVPLYNDSSKKYIGSLSMLDIVIHALSALGDSESESVSLAVSTLNEKEHFRNYKVKDVAGKARLNIPTVDSSSTVDVVAKSMVETKAHHVLGLNSDGELVNVISQSRIVECISSLFGVDPVLTKLGVKTVKELDMGLRDVISIQESDKAANAFRLLAEKNVSGIAVVNSSKQLVGNISVRDLRVIKSNASFLKLLSLPITAYAEAVVTESGVPKSVITCNPQDTYRTVLERVVSNKVHRCYVVNENNELIGVVSLWDLLNQLVSFSPK